jgi:hypothetical protein
MTAIATIFPNAGFGVIVVPVDAVPVVSLAV